MLRFSVEAGPQRANLCAVYALFGVVLIPISFLAIRLAQRLHPPGRVHEPRAADGRRRSSPRSASRWRRCSRSPARSTGVELLGKRLDARLRELREAAGVSTRARSTSPPPISSSSRSCSLYLVIMALKLHAARARGRRADRARRGERRARWLSCSSGRRSLAYGEAAVAYAGDARRPGTAGRLATWGVRARLAAPDGAARRRRPRGPTASRGRPGPAR